MGDPPHRAEAARERAREHRMRARTTRPAPPPPRRRRRLSPALRRALPGAIAVVLATGCYGGVGLRRLAIGPALLAGAADQALAASAALGLGVRIMAVGGRGAG